MLGGPKAPSEMWSTWAIQWQQVHPVGDSIDHSLPRVVKETPFPFRCFLSPSYRVQVWRATGRMSQAAGQLVVGVSGAPWTSGLEGQAPLND